MQSRTPARTIAMAIAAIVLLAVLGAATGFYLGQRYRPQQARTQIGRAHV